MDGPVDLQKLVKETFEKHGLDITTGFRLIGIAHQTPKDQWFDAALAALEEEAQRE